MTEQQKAAIKYMEAQLESGYIDLGCHEECELEIIKEAIDLWKIIDEWNSIGCTSFQLTSEEIKGILEKQEKKEFVFNEKITNDFFSSGFGRPLKLTFKGDLKGE